MKPNKDRPSTWIKYKKGMCTGCYGGCCTMPVEVHGSDLIRLGLISQDELAEESLKKISKRLIKKGIIKSFRQGTDLFMLTQKANDDCVFLSSQTRLCTVYDKRPDVCRKFPDVGPRPQFCPKTPA